MVGRSGFDWRLEKAARFLQAAEQAFLAEDWETTVSRSYYAAFHVVIALLESKTDLRIPRRHAQLHNLLRSTSFPPLLDSEDVASFEELYLKRQSADYDEDRPDFGIAANSLSKARMLHAKVVEIVNDAQI